MLPSKLKATLDKSRIQIAFSRWVIIADQFFQCGVILRADMYGGLVTSASYRPDMISKS